MRKSFLIIAVLAIVGGLFGGYALATFQQRASVAEETSEQIAAPAQSLAEEVEEACRVEDEDEETDALRDAGLCDRAGQVKDAIEDAPVEPAPSIRPAPGAAGTPGARGPAGQAGDGPTPSQVLDAVEATISAALSEVCGGTCVGPRGPAGQDGNDGAPSEVPGPAGPRGETGPQGPQGPAGEDGDDGSTGRSITDAQCGDDGRWTVTYSDGTSQDAGQCRASLLGD